MKLKNEIIKLRMKQVCASYEIAVTDQDLKHVENELILLSQMVWKDREVKTNIPPSFM